jgi:Ser/Thr protein kinase RdoA (MazF antagonist)
VLGYRHRHLSENGQSQKTLRVLGGLAGQRLGWEVKRPEEKSMARLGHTMLAKMHAHGQNFN